MKDTLIYCRVSTDEQANKGNGRDYQLEHLRNYCKNKGYEIKQEFLEDYSAKDFNRPEWNKLESLIKDNKKDIKRVIFTKWDRFTRNLEEGYKTIKKFKNWDIHLECIDQQIDINDENSKVLLSLYLILPEVENDKISSRTRDGMYQAAKEGAFLGTPPFGYKRHRIGKYASLSKNEEAKYVYDIFNEVSKGIKSREQIRLEFNKKGFNKSKQTFYNILQNQAYIGKVKVPEFKNQEPYWIKGLHESIIDEKTFYKVQSIISSVNRNIKISSKKNEKLPLRGFLVCENCGGNLTGSISKGNGGKYGYYHCNCKQNRISTIKAHELFNENVLSKIKVNKNVMELYNEVLKDVNNSYTGNLKLKEDTLLSKIEDFENKINNIEDKLADNEISNDIFQKMNNRYNSQINSLKIEIEELSNKNSLSDSLIDKACKSLENIPKLFDELDIDDKTEILGLIIPNKVIISKNNCRTNNGNKVIELLSRVSKASGGCEIKKAIKNDGLSNMAPPLGLEPRTL